MKLRSIERQWGFSRLLGICAVAGGAFGLLLMAERADAVDLQSAFSQKLALLELAEIQFHDFERSDLKAVQERLVENLETSGYAGPLLPLLENTDNSLDPTTNEHPVTKALQNIGYPYWSYQVQEQIRSEILSLTSEKADLLPMILKTMKFYDKLPDQSDGYYLPGNIAYEMVLLLEEIGEKATAPAIAEYAADKTPTSDSFNAAIHAVAKLSSFDYWTTVSLLADAKQVAPLNWLPLVQEECAALERQHQKIQAIEGKTDGPCERYNNFVTWLVEQRCQQAGTATPAFTSIRPPAGSDS